MSCLQTKYGAGYHEILVPLSDLKPAFQLSYGTLIVYQLDLSLTKISICLFYLRVFVDRLSRHLVFGTLVVIGLYTIPCEAVSIFQCSPIGGVYDFTLQSKCIDTLPCFYISSIANILLDAWLIALVASRIWKLRMAHRQKIALLSVITLGWLVIIAAIVRVIRITLILHQQDKTCRALLLIKGLSLQVTDEINHRCSI
jgi:hypothetical protein